MANSTTDRNDSVYLFLLLLGALILGASRGTAVPQIRVQERDALLLASGKGKPLTHGQSTSPAALTENLGRIAGGRRQLHALQQQRYPPNGSGTSLNASPPLHADSTRTRRTVYVDSTSFGRRILSSAETPLQEHTHAHEHGHDEEASADDIKEEDVEEEVEEDGEEEEADEEYVERVERAQQVDEGDTDEKENASTDGGKVSDSAAPGDPHKKTHMVRNLEDLSKTIMAAADETSEITSAGSIAGEQTSGGAQSGQIQDTKPGGGTTKQGSKYTAAFRGVPGGDIDGTNITHLSYMIYKIVKQYEIRTVIDIPCRNNLHWFPKLLHHIDFEVIGFKYICVDEGADNDVSLQSRFSDAGNPEFLSISPSDSANFPKSDLVFSYDGPQQWGVRQTWGFFTGLRKVRPKYIIVTNNPGQMNNDREHTLNLRKQPFHFAQAMRVISNVHTYGNPKQLLFYESQHIREGF